jgi:hypothetical protein
MVVGKHDTRQEKDEKKAKRNNRNDEVVTGELGCYRARRRVLFVHPESPALEKERKQQVRM